LTAVRRRTAGNVSSILRWEGDGVRYIVSACLAGVACRYDSGHSRHETVVRLVAEGRALPACPEQLGGLATPRAPAELRRGDGRDVLAGRAAVADASGRTISENFLKGAVEFTRLARTFGATGAVLRDRSPSCGHRRVYIDGQLKGGRGVAAALLEAEGVALFSADRLKDEQSGRRDRKR
jgi:uncharacterized protein YbbK (DUF523 family)